MAMSTGMEAIVVTRPEIMEARKWQNIPSCTIMEIIRSVTVFYIKYFFFYQFKIKVITFKNSASHDR